MQNVGIDTVKDPVQALRRFHHVGLRPEAAQGSAGLLPPHLAPPGASGYVRGAFPVCIIEGEEAVDVQSVTALVDEALAQLSLDEEETQRCVKILRRVEREIATMADEGAAEDLAGLWGTAVTILIADPDVPESEREEIRRYVSQVRGKIEADGLVIPFHPTTPMHLLHRVADHRRQQQAQHLDDLERLIARIQERLDGDLTPAPEERLTATLETLQVPWPDMLEDPEPNVADGAAAQALVEAAMQKRMAFLRALKVARLEDENLYDEELDDAYLAHFSASNLTTTERALCPPILLHLDTEHLDGSDFDQILALLDGGLPVKILLTVDQLHDTCAAPPCLSGWRMRLAERAMASGRAFVMQATAAQAGLLMQGFNEGVRYDGPALFCIYTGAGAETPHLHPYLAAQAALTSRTFPAFVYDPSKGDDWAARFRLAENPDPEQPWAEVETPGSEGITHAFTPIGFLACDQRLDGQFMIATPTLKQDDLTPLTAYLASAPQDRAAQIPYIILADEKGKQHQVVCTQSTLHTAEMTASRWRNLQELGGINNSHAVKAVAAEKARLEQAFEAEKAALAKQHQAEIEQVTEAVAQKLVSNIAAGLLNLTESGVGAALPLPEIAEAPPAEAPKKEEEPEPPPAAEAEAEDDDLSFDEPYIDTPECTSCDECINLNAAIFAYNEDDKAYIKDPRGGPYKDLVEAAEVCPARIIHPGKPLNPKEPGLEELLQRAEPYL